jgi:glycerophosphoryl diester phosphodiesterase
MPGSPNAGLADPRARDRLLQSPLHPARILHDEAIASSWRRVVRLWRPMAGWTVLVWASVAILLGPLSSFLLGWQVLRGPGVVVGNEALLVWLLTPRGVLWTLLAGGLTLLGGVVRYAGLFHIVTDDLSGHRPTVRRAALHLVPRLPAIFRLSLVAAAAGVAVTAILIAGLAAVRVLFLAEFDINYYLAGRPREWRYALVAASAWTGLWLVGALFVLGRTVLAIPAYLDGHQPLRVAFARARERGRRQKPRLFRVLGLAAGVWLVGRLAAHSAYYAAGSATVAWVASVSSSLRPVVLATASYGAVLFALDAVIGFLGFSLVATVLTKFYFEDTDLHAVAPPAPTLRQLPWRLMRRARPWLRPRRLLPLAAVLAALSAGASGILLQRVPVPARVEIIAHRAGPPPAPENTLAALERSILAGADHAEIDVQRTRDGVVVVVHDADLMRVAGDPRRIADVTYPELAGVVQRPDDGSPPEERRVATLDDFLERARGRIGLSIELKYYGPDPGLAPAVVERVRASAMEGEIVVMSLSVEAVEQLARAAPDLTIGYVSAAAVGDPTRLPVSFLAVSRAAATPRLLRSARERGVSIQVWTINRSTVMAELIERGVDGLITDDPALAVRVRDEMLELSTASRLLLRFRPAAWEAPEPRGGGG